MLNLKKYLICSLALTLLMSSCQENCIKGEGDLVDESRVLESFHAVHIDCDAHVTFHRADDGKSRLDMLIQQNLISGFKSKVVDGTLVLEHENCVGKHTPISIDVYLAENIDEMRLGGTGDIVSEDILPASDLKLTISGTSKCTLGFTGNRLEIVHAGTDDLLIKGNCDELNAVLSGTGNLELLGVPAAKAKVNLSGTGDVKLTVTESLAVNLSGTGNVRYRGTPRMEEENVTGTGDIKQLSGY